MIEKRERVYIFAIIVAIVALTTTVWASNVWMVRYNTAKAELQSYIENPPDPEIVTIYIDPTPMPVPDPEDITTPWTELDVLMMAQTIEGEAGVCTTLGKSGVAWTILNRVDSPRWPDTIVEVITQKNQFQGYHSTIEPSEASRTIAEDVLARWWLEKTYGYSYGRTLPKEYLYFRGDHVRTNYFYKVDGGTQAWDWSWGNPYEEVG